MSTGQVNATKLFPIKEERDRIRNLVEMFHGTITNITVEKGIKMDSVKIAKVAHEVNREYCIALGDNSQSKWENAPDWQKKSAINGVEFHRNNPDAGPQASHVSWLKEKEADGWAYGKTKDPELKTHPCFMPYDKLPVEQRAKDYIFRAIVHELLDQ